MRRKMKSYLSLTAVTLSVLCWMPTLHAQQRGNLGNGGARGGGGGRTSTPSRPSPSRPSPQARPSMPQPKLPAGGGGNVSKPKLPSTRPSLPAAKPNLPSTLPGNASRPNPTQRPNPTPRPAPTTRPDNNRPNVDRPNLSRPTPNTPTVRPGTLPGGGIVKPNQPTTKPAPRPGLGPNRPSTGIDLDKLPERPSTRPTGPLKPSTRPGGDLTRPSLPIDRPTTKPGDRPDISNRPPRPNIPERPSIPNRPNIPERPRPERPNLPERPNFPDRPVTLPSRPIDRPSLGGGSNRPNFGGSGGSNRPIIGGGNNNNIGNNININNNWNNWNNININRPNNWNNNWGNNWNNNWGNNWNNNWGNNWNNNHWGDYWYSNHINQHHHSWYHGCWHGHWGGAFYRPVVFGASIWGLYGWGFQPTYINPYYVAPAVATTPVYNYSQPVVVYNYSTTNNSTDNSSVSNTTDTTPANASSTADYSSFDESLQLFKAGNFRQALVACDAAIAKSPNDPVIHEVRALIQFALGQYASAAAVLNSLLAASPGMDWTTLSSLYDDVDTYTEQLRLLENYCKSNPKDAAAQFVLAYHYMVAGYSEEAADVLKVVVELQPKDLVAKQMLESLVPPDAESANATGKVASPPPAPAATPVPSNTASRSPAEPTPVEAEKEADGPTTDLVGGWKASEGKGTITLDIDENFEFTWKAINEGSPAIDLSGNLMIQGEMMILSNEQQGNLTGKVISGGADKFTFVPSGSPADYQGLIFERVAPSN